MSLAVKYERLLIVIDDEAACRLQCHAGFCATIEVDQAVAEPSPDNSVDWIVFEVLITKLGDRCGSIDLPVKSSNRFALCLKLRLR